MGPRLIEEARWARWTESPSSISAGAAPDRLHPDSSPTTVPTSSRSSHPEATRSRPTSRARRTTGESAASSSTSPHPKVAHVALRLVDGADVVLESWRPGVAARLGLGYTDLSPRCPRLVYCSISGAGTEGEDADLAGYESLVAARTGLMADRLPPDAPPVYPGVPLAGMGAGLLAVIGIGAALVARESTGRGQLVETSMLDGVLAFMTMFWESLEHLPDASAPSSLAPSRRLLVGSFVCGDGEYLGVHTGANGSHARLMTAMGLADRVPPAAGQPREDGSVEPRGDGGRRAGSTEALREPTRAYWEERLLAADVTAIPIHRPTEVFDEAQVAHNDATVHVRDAELGDLEQVGVAARLTGTPGAVRSGAPLPGADSDEILHALGYDAAAIDALRRSGIVS